ncbi:MULTISPECIES: nucleotide sugar dehydrogenase [Idiomarina]|uniref:nucleotide sugar dehydrogenase n=1 Tax=Idiomarina TaxID=135575 RepID=UPI00129CCCB6|nr:MULTISPECIES: nucleotide sugar dehydrogenase [Idiomarina]MRJ42540.1 nucleotide sugar dehydrogenase [Idiomarina sp. FeN1]NCU58153.1 nucleotide sugar dehydrogenase [Idiomarina sp. FenA--70]NCU60851.1 nucleotide sugar dehydrogenase [Idiomarina sp. FenBw--71]UUN12749.1 nucleotide sugar dehydrogenase [Idiomarina loihiensis]
MQLQKVKLAVIGLGYVGLPLAVEFAKKYPTLGFDINTSRVAELQQGYDRTQEVDAVELAQATHIKFSANTDDLAHANVFIVTVPTPINKHKQPDLTPLYKASETIGKFLKRGDIVIYESTVYPGATEEDCVPVLERVSGLTFNKDFYAGYSPERINPGDKEHRVTNILKVTAGSTPEVADFVNSLYASIITAGTHKASSIRVAEAAKVIENTQRDVNIALINELAMLFNQMGINTHEVLAAAATKWNFLPFKPGLVGGHCIGVDPYYLTHKAQSIGFHPEMILAGRRINDNMSKYVAADIVKQMLLAGKPVRTSSVLMLGVTFKENCPDIRNTKVIDLVHELESFGASVDIYDPWADAEEATHELGVSLLSKLPEQADYHSVVLAVAHQEFVQLAEKGFEHLLDNSSASANSNSTSNENDTRFSNAANSYVVYDLKNILPAGTATGGL